MDALTTDRSSTIIFFLILYLSSARRELCLALPPSVDSRLAES
jgi:hypothetical protein